MEGYIGEIRLFAGNFAPLGWAFCDGTQYSISMYEASFAILGTIYGGNGQTTFAVPDLRSRIAVGTGTGAGLTNISLGQAGGSESAVMTLAQMPAHNHSASSAIGFPAYSDSGDTGSPSGTILGGLQGAYSTQPADTHIAPATTTGSLSVVGGGMPFGIIQPVLATNYIICLEGIFPSRS
ncbi:phage tail protein [Chryseobacterium aquaticum]|uniref:Phage tail protein n=1 Tax=Chryseobacterium aquaticum TaxID=452084 RepID=A0A848N6J5_9FLAO|nr:MULTISPECIES: tail fiber protein [Chryseobacterium]NMR34368.1 phage tail protein [Chryseobacterium aquaticum]NRQ46648.1 tail fiber protein [Chryseobacterium sp. C-204]